MIKKLKLVLIAISSVVILTACQLPELDILDGGFSIDKITSLFSSNNDNGNSGNDNLQNNSDVANGGGEVAASEKEFENIDDNDIEQIFDNMAEAFKSVESVTSVVNSETKDVDESTPTVTKTKSKIIINPLLFHLEFEGDIDVMEMYANENEVYAQTPGQGWIVAPDELGRLINVQEQINEEHILHYKDYLEFFEATSDDTHYIITYVGPDDMYNEVFLNEDIMDAVFGDLLSALEGLGDLINMEMWGDVTMRVSKDTFLVDEQEMMTHSKTSIFGFGIESVEQSVQTLTYNDVEPFSIPDEVIQNALKMKDQLN